MPRYEYFCHACKKPFSKTLTPSEYEEGGVVCPHCGSEEVEERRVNILPYLIERDGVMVAGPRLAPL